MCKGCDLSHLTLASARSAWFHTLHICEALSGKRKETPLVENSHFIGCWQHFPLARGCQEAQLLPEVYYLILKWRYSGWSTSAKGENPTSYI